MAKDFAYHLILTPPGGGESQDMTALVQSVTWQGDIRQTARELSASLAVPRDGSVEIPTLEEGAWLTMQVKDRPLFFGALLQCTTNSQSVVVNVSALDRGRFFVGNRGWYKFTDTTPEAAATLICGDFGIPVGKLAATGVSLTQNFPRTSSLDKIIRTPYTMAGEQNGKRYVLRFTGEGALEVVEKPIAATLEIVQTMGVTNTWDIKDLCTGVAIYTDDGALVRRVEDSASQALNGRLEHVITQRSGEDAGAEAQAWLEDNGLQQSLTVEVLSPPLELISGAAVILRDTGSGVSGLFWVDQDTHTWKNGQHFGKFRLNFRNLMQ
mgnify:CR=1 FL=1